jgi:hypothetical protein
VVLDGIPAMESQITKIQSHPFRIELRFSILFSKQIDPSFHNQTRYGQHLHGQELTFHNDPSPRYLISPFKTWAYPQAIDVLQFIGNKI